MNWNILKILKLRRNQLRIILLSAFMSLLPDMVQAQFTFVTNADNTITITGYMGSGGAVIIPSSTNGFPVDSIGTNAFRNNNRLYSITVPNTVFTIEDYAFFGCQSLTNVSFSTNLTSIGDYAFYYCMNLTNVSLPLGVRRIGDFAFSLCIGPRFNSIFLPDSVTNIGTGAFSSCSHLYSISVSTNNLSYSSVAGVLFSKDQSLLIQYPSGRPGIYTVTDTVYAITEGAFQNAQYLTSVSLPGSVTNIGISAFGNCLSLAAISVDTLNNFYSSADGVLFDKNDTTLIQAPPSGISGTYAITNTVTKIGTGAFYHCTSLTEVIIPDSVTNIENSALNYCTSLTNVLIGNNVIILGNYAFYATKIAGFLITGTVTSIGDYTFGSCYGLKSITIGAKVASIGSGAFEQCGNMTNVTISDSVVNIGSSAFYNCSSLNTVTMGSNVTNIGDYVFKNCSKLANLTIPNSVRSIGTNAFYYCSSLTRVRIPDSVTNIGDGAFSGCYGLTNIAISSNVTKLGNGTFSGCYGLTSISIPNGVVTIGNSVFSGCTGLTNVIFSPNLTDIATGAFFDCTRLTSVNLPLSVSTIGDQAFCNCYSLTTVNISSNVINIGSGAFSGCNALTLITVDPGNLYYSSVAGVLYNKAQTTLIQFPAGKSGNYTIPSGVDSIADAAFWECPSIKNVIVPRSVANIGEDAFFGCYNMSGFYFMGNAPGTNFDAVGNSGTVYYLPGTMGWAATFAGRPTAPWFAPNPMVLTFEPNFGVQTNNFGFSISWSTNTSVVVEACTNLSNPDWQPVQTNTLTSGSAYFSDPQWTNYPGRFYRLRSL